MKFERLGNIFWLLAFIYFAMFVAGQADALFGGLLPVGHHDVETPIEPYAALHKDEVDSESVIALGEKVFNSAGCMACHQIGLVGNNIGPSLSNAAMRYQPEQLLKKLNEPQSLVPNSMMPSYAYLSDDEKEALVAYIGTFNNEREGIETGAGEVPEEILAKAAPMNPDSALIERGLNLFKNNGCGACHTIAGVDGAVGNQGPNLTREGLRGRTDEWQGEHINNSLSVYTFGDPEGGKLMPNYNITGDDLISLVAYLQSLR